MPRYDIHIQLIDPSQQGTSLTFTFGHSPTVAVRGPQKLANRWIMQFLRLKGSDPVDLNAGTEFRRLINGNVTDGDDLQAIVLEHIDDCSDQIRAIDQRSPWLDADERLRSAELVLFEQVRENAFEMWVQITTISGDSAKVLIPYARI